MWQLARGKTVETKFNPKTKVPDFKLVAFINGDGEVAEIGEHKVDLSPLDRLVVSDIGDALETGRFALPQDNNPALAAGEPVKQVEAKPTPKPKPKAKDTPPPSDSDASQGEGFSDEIPF